MAEAFGEASAGAEFEAPHSQSLDRLCALAADALNVPVAVLVLTIGSVSRVIASIGLPARFRSRVWTGAQLPFEPASEVIHCSGPATPALEAKLAFLGLPKAGFFLRTPIETVGDNALSLTIASAESRKRPTAREFQILGEIKTLIHDAFPAFEPLLTDPDADVTAVTTLADACAEVRRSPTAQAILDAEQRTIAASPAMAAILSLTPDTLVGKRHTDISVPMANAIGTLYSRAIETRISPPDIEVVTEGRGGLREVHLVSVSPFSPVETRDYFLFVTARNITDLQARERALARRISHDDAPAEPSLAFLRETLVARRAIRSRKSVNYLTLRSWRSPIREWQIKALRALKANIPTEMPAGIAGEMLDELNALVGVSAFRAIVPMPCGHTREGPCLSVEIARALAAKLGIPVVQAFATKPMKGSSHPKENLKRPPLMLVQPVTEPVLLVDDVATSGAHIEEAVTLLRQHTGSVLAMAWISGDST